MRCFLHITQNQRLVLVALDEDTFTAASKLHDRAMEAQRPAWTYTNLPEMPLCAVELGLTAEAGPALWQERIGDWLKLHSRMDPEEVFASPGALNTPAAPSWGEVPISLLVASMHGADPVFQGSAQQDIDGAFVDPQGHLWLDAECGQIRLPRDMLGFGVASPAMAEAA